MEETKFYHCFFFLQLRNKRNISEQYLKTYCFAAHYINTLLADGYKFDKDNWNHINFRKEVGFHSKRLKSDQ